MSIHWTGLLDWTTELSQIAIKYHIIQGRTETECTYSDPQLCSQESKWLVERGKIGKDGKEGEVQGDEMERKEGKEGKEGEIDSSLNDV